MCVIFSHHDPVFFFRFPRVYFYVGTSERTREVVLDGMKKIHEAFQEHGLVANVRLETYDGERYFHVPPPASSRSSTTHTHTK